MMRIAFKIEEQDAGERMDIVLSRLLEDTSRSGVQKLIEKGGVLVNGIPVLLKSTSLQRAIL